MMLWSWWAAASVMTAVIAVQWGMLTMLLFHNAHCGSESDRATAIINPLLIPPPSSVSASRTTATAQDQEAKSTSWKGVAVTLALSAPKWFHRRYVVMIQNVLMNTPEDWAVQIMANGHWWDKEIMLHHQPGMGRLLQHPRVILTKLPDDFVHPHHTYKPKQVMTTMWFWETLVADRVLVFSGNGALCSNAKVKWVDFDSRIDFMGVPSHHRSSRGGDTSTHSLRNRPAMVAALKEFRATNDDKGNNNNNNNLKNNNSNQPLDFGDSEGEFFVKQMQKMNQVTSDRFRLATYEEMVLFGGIEPLLTDATTPTLREDYERVGPPLIVSGTLASLPFDVRDAILNICPEVKVIFPSLHEPGCFGAHPEPDKCAGSICALRNPLPKQGC